MQSLLFLREIERFNKPVLSFNDSVKILRKSRAYTRLYMHRLKKRHLIKEIEKGKYALSENTLEIGSNMLFPSYVSFLSAYSIYGFTTQILTADQIVCQKPKKKLFLYNTRIDFITFKKQNIFGYKREKFRNKYIFIAEPEKAIADSLYLPKYCPISETFEALSNKELDINKLVEYSIRMNSIVLLKRLGYLLELRNIDIHYKIKDKLNKRYDILNPLMKKKGQKSNKWKLIINEAL